MTGASSPGWVDAHQHFWDVESGAYDWPTAAEGDIYRTFGPDDLAPELVSAGIERTVIVQTVNTLADTDSMLAVAGRHPFVAGVVGWVPMADARATTAALDARPTPRLRGIRHLIHHEPDPGWLTRPEVAGSLDVLAERRLPFDVVAVFPNHLSLVPGVADRHPELTLVIDHLGKPPYRATGWDAWVTQLRAVAKRPNVVAKLSGLDTAAGAGWSAAELAPAVDIALEAFGPSRLMFGSDWPVCRSVSTYREVVAAAQAWTATLSPDEQADVMGRTAERVYRL